MKKILLLLSLAHLTFSPAYGEDLNQSLLFGAPSVESGQDHLINHTIFSVMYDLGRGSPDWVAEYLTKEEVDSETVSRDRFHFADDPLIDGEATDADYAGSGYDRGHMVPAEDMEMDARWMTECFYMTNMAPQRHALNGGRWKTMEELARKVAVKEGKAWIFSGTIYRDPRPGECSGVIGTKNKITIPQAFFKIIVFKEGGSVKSIAFIIPHLLGPASAYGSVGSYLTSIDEVEAETGFDFLDKVPVETQAVIEAEVVPVAELALF